MKSMKHKKIDIPVPGRFSPSSARKETSPAAKRRETAVEITTEWRKLIQSGITAGRDRKLIADRPIKERNFIGDRSH